MGVFEFMVGRKKPTPGEMAKERLKVVLVHDRLKISPEMLESIKKEILNVVSRRLDVDENQMHVSLTRAENTDLLKTHVPIKRQKVSFEWDPPSNTPSSSNQISGKIRIEESNQE
jgi:cell division topological specificity factor